MVSSLHSYVYMYVCFHFSDNPSEEGTISIAEKVKNAEPMLRWVSWLSYILTQWIGAYASNVSLNNLHLLLPTWSTYRSMWSWTVVCCTDLSMFQTRVRVQFVGSADGVNAEHSRARASAVRCVWQRGASCESELLAASLTACTSFNIRNV